MSASSKGHLEIIKYLIAKGADVNTYDGRALGAASWSGNLEIVKYLIAKGADVNAKNRNGKTSLQVAEEYKHQEIANYLKKHGATE